MNPLILINDSIPNLMECNIKEFPNFKRNFSQYLLEIILGDHQYSQCRNIKNPYRTSNIEQHLRNSLKKRQPDSKTETDLFIIIDELVPFFTEQCLQNFMHVDHCFASYYIHLLIRDSQDGLELNGNTQGISVCKIEQFLLTALVKYKDPTDSTVCSMKISYYCKNNKELHLNSVKEKYELDFNNKLQQLKNSILQYPETSNSIQLEEMFLKMQVFIITNYQIGYPENYMLLKQCRQSLQSILGKGDIQKYVLRKRYNRLEYLQKLGATAAGILIFNNQGPEGDKENVRNIFADLKMAKYNTTEAMQEGFDWVICLKQKAFKVMSELIAINVQEKNIRFLRHITEIRELNKFVALFEVYRRNLQKAKTAFEKTLYLMEVDQRKFDFVVEKINNILKYRSAIESELIFPHFVYLSEIWKSLVLYLNHLVDINKIKDYLDGLFCKQTKNKFNELLEDLSDKSRHLKHPLKYSFQEVVNSTGKHESKLNILNIKPFVKDYCALTMAMTGGFLVPSQLEKKLCENVDLYFGFANIDYAAFVEHHFKDILQVFRTTVLTCSDLIVLFELDEEVMQEDSDLIQQTQAKTKTTNTQTEMISNEILQKNPLKANWNVWDFHRQTIKLANIRKRQTSSTQSNLSYGLRNAQNQFNRKSNI